MHLILISRVSDVNQRPALPAQKLRLKQYAIGKDPKAEYHEFDESAHKDVRKRFGKLVEHIKSQKEPCAVVFDKIDRYTRDQSQDEVRTLNQLVKTGKIELHFPSDNLFITKNSPATDLFRLGIGMALAKYYSDTISDNVKRRHYQMLNDGIWIGYSPIGFSNVHSGTIAKPVKEIIVDEERAPHIVTIFEKRAAGMSYEAIAELVNEKGLTSKTNKPLHKNAIERIIQNPWYHGYMTYNGKLYKHKYPTLITKELYDKCQEVGLKRKNGTGTAYRSLPFTFNNLIKCKECGCRISSFRNGKWVYLNCSQAKYRCGNVNTAESLILPDIEELISLIALSDDKLKLIVDEIKRRHSSQQFDFEAKIKTTRSEYDKITARLKALTYERLDSLNNGKGIGTELFDEIVEELTIKQQKLNQELIKLTDSNFSFLITASHLIDLAQRSKTLFETLNNQGRQKLLRFLLSNCTLYDKKLNYEVNDPYKTFIELNTKKQNVGKNKSWCG